MSAFAAYTEALAEAFTADSLREAKTAVALSLASRAARSLEINLKRVDGRETAGIVVSTYEEKMHFLTAARAALAILTETPLADSSGTKTDFSFSYVDP